MGQVPLHHLVHAWLNPGNPSLPPATPPIPQSVLDHWQTRFPNEPFDHEAYADFLAKNPINPQLMYDHVTKGGDPNQLTHVSPEWIKTQRQRMDFEVQRQRNAQDVIGRMRTGAMLGGAQANLSAASGLKDPEDPTTTSTTEPEIRKRKPPQVE